MKKIATSPISVLRIPRPVVVQPSPVIFPARVREGVGGRYAGRRRFAKGLIHVLALYELSTVGQRQCGAETIGEERARSCRVGP
jgi:hypothetical protein